MNSELKHDLKDETLFSQETIITPLTSTPSRTATLTKHAVLQKDHAASSELYFNKATSSLYLRNNKTHLYSSLVVLLFIDYVLYIVF